MPEASDAGLGQRAVEWGYLTAAQLAECLREQAHRSAPGGTPVPLAEVLVERGRLSRDQLAALAASVAGGIPSPTPASAGETPYPTLLAVDELLVSRPHAGDGAAPRAALERIGKYQLLAEVGRGGMGTVYRAWDASLDRTVALKVLRLESAPRPGPLDATQSDEALRRFHREAQTLARLHHPNIVRIYEVGEAEGRPFLALEFVGGGSLRDLLPAAGGGRPGATEVAKSGVGPPAGRADLGSAGLRAPLGWMIAVCRAVHHAHQNGIMHRDLKPENILFKREESEGREQVVPMVADFGLARQAGPASQLTQAGQVLGTPSYMAPEQCDGRGVQDGRCDVFSLGAILYELVTGARPFGGDSPLAIMYAVMERDPAPPRRLNPRLAADVETIVLKALEKDPAQRYATAEELADDLGRHLEGEPIRARQLPAAVRVLRRIRKHRSVVLPGAAVALLAFGLVAYGWAGAARRAAAIESALAAGRSLRAAGRAGEARDAFQQVLVLDPGQSEGRAGFAWADAEVRRAAAEVEAARARAVEAEAAAREMLEKAGRVENVLARWTLLAPTLRELESVHHDSRFGPAERRQTGERLWPRVAEFMRETQPDPASQATMRALAGWARHLAGYEEEGATWMRAGTELDPGLPYGALMQALTCFEDCLLQQALPPIEVGRAGLRLGMQPTETAEMRALRDRIDRLLAGAAGARIWGEGIARDFRTTIGALQALQAGRYEEAERGLSAVMATAAVQVFRAQFLLARAQVRYLLRRFDGALADLDGVLRAWPEQAGLLRYRGLFLSGAAADQIARGADPRTAYAEAVAAFGRAIDGRADAGEILSERAAALRGMGEAQAARGEDPRESYRRAIEDCDRAVAVNPRLWQALVNRGLVRVRMEHWAAAIADFEAALKLVGDGYPPLQELLSGARAQAAGERR